ncbi:Conserved hypothetical protein, putative regulator of chromosome condensation [Herminiimonas arsenicoxydans]|uniref:RCC1-like domain-containing protein n=1 Tax=Herminiimonas arsenicoxydans TaxID=204773 RepID=A4G759_HERAR|nr:Conserved hypothetical protein, putative regulator of chromosome condensation [Herminiimonas arsenicoxydans]
MLMFKKTFLSVASAAALLGASAAPAFAASSFYLVVPVPTAAKAPVEDIRVSLAGAALPKATVSKAYSESLRPYLSVTGDAAFDPAAASWSLADGILPAGLVLDETTGAVAGTPSAKTTTPVSFTVLATYMGSDGQAVYTIEVAGAVLHVRNIAAGEQHTCAVTDAGGVKCWGLNDQGQLGDNSTTSRMIPVDVAGLGSGVSSINAGRAHTCAIAAGALKCWGENIYGQLGDNSATQRNAPVDVAGLGSGVASVSAGHSHNCAITTSGAVKCWGWNAAGQLGIPPSVERWTPVDVVQLGNDGASIAAGGLHTCATTKSGAVKCWGWNAHGQLGDNSTTQRDTPMNVVGLESGVSSIAAGLHHNCAVMTTGAAKCWGWNEYSQLGDNSATQRNAPVDVAGSGVASIAADLYHTCAVMTTGAAKCWGRNDYGQLGDNSLTDSPTPVNVSGLASGVSSIASGYSHTCAVLTTGQVKCWGRNDYGQVGDGSTTVLHLTPVDVQGN